MTLHICDDRLCQDCDDLNRAAFEGRACAEQSTDDAETQSAPAATTGTTSATSNSKSIRSELLCYVANKMDLVVHDSLIKLCTDFYDTKLSKALSKCCSTVLLSLIAVLDTRDDKVRVRTRTVQLPVSPIYTTQIMTIPQEYEGQWTAKTNIHLEHLLGGALQRAPQNCLTLGLMFELHRLRNRKFFNVATLTGWINTVFGLNLHSDFVYPKVKDINRTRGNLRKKYVEITLPEKETRTYFTALHIDHTTMWPVPDQQTGSVSMSTAGTQTADHVHCRLVENNQLKPVTP